MRTIKLIGCISILLVLASCTSLHKSTQSTAVYAPNARIKPIYADVDVKLDKKLEGTASSTYFFFFKVEGDTKYADGVHYSIGGGSSVISSIPFLGIFSSAKKNGLVRQAAAYNAMSTSDADILVNPQYMIETKSYLFLKQFRATVTGYAGYFEDFYQKDTEDIEKAVSDYLERGGSMNLRLDLRGDQ